MIEDLFRVTSQQATVWRSLDNRRSFTKLTAARRSARYLIRSRYPCECERPEHQDGYPGFVCYRHREHGIKWFAEVERRLAIRLMRASRP